MKGHYLILDCDGVIFDSLPLIDEQVKKIDEIASDEYGRKLLIAKDRIDREIDYLEDERDTNSKRMQNLLRRRENIIALRREHYDHKDIVLEEVYPQFEGLINYDIIYQIENTFPGAVRLIRDISTWGIYEKIIISSQVNTDREINAKKNFFSKYLPMVEFVPVKFHEEPYFDPVTGLKNENRARSIKIDSVKKTLGIHDFSQASFVDDTKIVLDEANEAGVAYCFHKKITDDIIHILRTACYCNLFSLIDMNNKGRVKKLF